MSNLIALMSFADLYSWSHLLEYQTFDTSKLKQVVLLFDKVGIVDLELHKSDHSPMPNLIAEIEWLQQEQVLFDVGFNSMYAHSKYPAFIEYITEDNYELSYQRAVMKAWNTAMDQEGRSLHKLNRELKATGSKVHKLEINEGNPIPADMQERIYKSVVQRYKDLKASDAILSRIFTPWVEYCLEGHTIPLLHYSDFLREIKHPKKYDVVEIVINNIPLPDENTPWEKILEYRNNPDVQRDIISLRRWMRKTTTMNLSPIEIEEELEWLVNEFQYYMKLHHIKANTETIEAIMKAPLEILEDLVKFKFSKLLDPLFSLKKREISLMEAELHAPGREVAYLVHTKEFFDTN